jgi:hypothetical protein
MIAIQTRFIGQTNFKGSRIVAETMESKPRRIYVGSEDALGIEQNHYAAAKALIHKLGWDDDCYGEWFGGGSERGYVFVCAVKHAKLSEVA